MATVKCVMMQRDEELLIEPWLRYYGYLFGFENLAVFDNGSVLEGVIQTLRRFERVGVKVYWNFAGTQHFQGKGFHFTNVIKGWDFGGGYDFALPVDCDEFIAVIHPDGLSCQRSMIHQALDGLRGERMALGIEFSMFNIPGQAGRYRPQHYPKGFLASGTIRSLDHGHHYPAAEQSGRRETDLTFLHYHHKPFRMMVEHARRKLEGVIDLDRPELSLDHTGSGNHLIKLLMMTEQDYVGQFNQSLMLEFGGLEDLLRLLSPLDGRLFPLTSDLSNDKPTDTTRARRASSRERSPEFAEFLERDYYRFNPDVQKHGIEGLKHYIRHGFDEIRSICEADAEIRSSHEVAAD